MPSMTAAEVIAIFAGGCSGGARPKLFTVTQIDQLDVDGNPRFAINHSIAGAVLCDIQIQHGISAKNRIQLWGG